MTSDNILKFYTRLRKTLSLPLPGTAAQLNLAIISRRTFARSPRDAKQAAVCSVIYPHQNKIRLAFIQRATHDKDRHSGQISFPGGQIEDGDKHMLDTAIRELAEETGISISKHHVLGKLSTLYIPVSNFLVQPFVIGLLKKPQVLRQVSEVEEIFGFDLDRLIQLPVQRKSITGQGFTIPDAPFFDLDGRTLWGATAMMTNELLEVIRNSNEDGSVDIE